MLTWLSKHVFFPLWEIKDGARRAQYLRELSASQWLTAETLRKRQWERLSELLSYSQSHVPYYQSIFARAQLNGAPRNWDEFRRLPLLSKRDIRNSPDGLLSREFRREELVEARTGGSTGVALTLYADKRCQQIRNAAAMRSDRWAGWDIGTKVAAIWGNPPVANTLKKRLRSLLLDRTIYLDTMEINTNSVRRFVYDWRRHKPQVIFGHSHSIFILATYLQRMGVEDIRPRGIVSTSMMLLVPERRLIEAVFGCQVTNRYGCEEVGLIACECDRHDGFHLNIDHVVVEFLKEDGTEARAGEEANIVVTDLVNRAMPLIRYEVGDMGVPSDRTCTCGRGLPLMERIIGRQADFLKKTDGSLVAGVSLVERTLTAISGLEQMQIIQDDLKIIQANVVSGAGYTSDSERQLTAVLNEVFGSDVAIRICHVPALQSTARGKYRFAICNV